MAIPEPNSAFQQDCDQADTLCFFGLGTLFHDCLPQLLLAAGRIPDVLCDNAPEKWGKSHAGLLCISPKDLLARPGRTVILICMRNADAVADKFTALGCYVFIAQFDRFQHGVRSIVAGSALTKRLAAISTPAPMRDMAGRWALVTGASRGLGRQIACALARLGVHLVLHARTTEHLTETSDICSGFGVQTHLLAADLGQPEAIDLLLGKIDRLKLPIDILYNNAGISPSSYGSFWNTPADAFASAFTVNTLAPIRLSQHLLPTMIARRSGRIINVSSSIQRRPAEIAYACSKAALDKFVFDICDTLQGTGVMISLLDPGWLQTDMGGPDAPFRVDSALTGALLAAVVDGDVNGRWIAAQDYSSLSLNDAIRKAVANGIGCRMVAPDLTFPSDPTS